MSLPGWELAASAYATTLQPDYDADWADAWKRHYVPQRIGRVVIVPSWVSHEAEPDDAVVVLDPGMAFGTGLHPTTRACLTVRSMPQSSRTSTTRSRSPWRFSITWRRL